jgi:Protein of unknown function (DUF2723).
LANAVFDSIINKKYLYHYDFQKVKHYYRMVGSHCCRRRVFPHVGAYREWWDCGEYISTAYKLQVGHPPGAPLFQMIGRFFSLFAGGDVTKVAMMVNVMSAICSGLTIVFLFWTITMMVRKVWMKEGEDAPWVNKIGVLLAGFVGAWPTPSPSRSGSTPWRRGLCHVFTFHSHYLLGYLEMGTSGR